jgi:hypothetical protein
MALLNKENKYIKISPLEGAVETSIYNNAEHRIKEKENKKYIEFLLQKSEEMKNKQYEKMISVAQSLHIDENSIVTKKDEKDILENNPQLKKEKNLYDLCFKEHLALISYLNNGIIPKEKFNFLESYIGKDIPLELFFEFPKIVVVSVNAEIKDQHQAYESVKEEKIFGETQDC